MGYSWPVEGNPFGEFNLPPNYATMTPAEQKQWRVSAIQTQDTPENTLRAWRLLRTHYLASLPGFYKRWVPSPLMHYRWIWCVASHARCMIAAPRGFSKTTVLSIEWPVLLALGRPGTDILVCFNRDRLSIRRGRKLGSILMKCQAIKEDFGDLRGDTRGEDRAWNVTTRELSNGSAIRYTSVSAHNLGDRPDYIIWDDVDPDPQKVRNWEQVVTDTTDALFNVYLPMLEGGAGFLIVGTLLHRAAFLYNAMTSKEERLSFFHREVSAIVDKNGNPEWPEKYDKRAIRQLIQEIGQTAFDAQYMNDPHSSADACLRWHDRRTAYDVIDEDRAFAEDPLASKAKLVRYRSDNLEASPLSEAWRQESVEFGQWAGKLRRILVADSSGDKPGRHTDFSALLVVGIDATDTWWVLDAWQERKTPAKVAEELWRMANKWQVSLVGVEAVGIYKELLQQVLNKKAKQEAAGLPVPKVKKISYEARITKESRILGLEWRFDAGRVKVRNSLHGYWKALRSQIIQFTPDLANLPHDDLIDTLAMVPYAVGYGVPENAISKEADDWRVSFAKRLIAGDFIDKQDGQSIVLGVDYRTLPIGPTQQRIERDRVKRVVEEKLADDAEAEAQWDVDQTFLSEVKGLQSWTLEDFGRIYYRVNKRLRENPDQ